MLLVNGAIGDYHNMVVMECRSRTGNRASHPNRTKKEVDNNNTELPLREKKIEMPLFIYP